MHMFQVIFLFNNNNNNNNDLEVAHPRSGSSSTWFLVELEFGNVGFWWEGKTGVPGEKPLAARERTNNKLNPHASTGVWTRAALVGGECSHHCAIPGSSLLPKDDNILEHRYWWQIWMKQVSFLLVICQIKYFSNLEDGDVNSPKSSCQSP